MGLHILNERMSALFRVSDLFDLGWGYTPPLTFLVQWSLLVTIVSSTLDLWPPFYRDICHVYQLIPCSITLPSIGSDLIQWHFSKSFLLFLYFLAKSCVRVISPCSVKGGKLCFWSPLTMTSGWIIQDFCLYRNIQDNDS